MEQRHFYPKTLDDLLLLGDPRLYEACSPITTEEIHLVPGWVADLHNVMEEVRAKYGFGRGIAAPQLGIMKRLFYLNVQKPITVINPILTNLSQEKMVIWDDCMCFPNLLVRVERHQQLTLLYKDEHWQDHRWEVKDDLAELVQHEYDHLDGILCTMRALDDRSLKWRK